MAVDEQPVYTTGASMGDDSKSMMELGTRETDTEIPEFYNRLREIRDVMHGNSKNISTALSEKFGLEMRPECGKASSTFLKGKPHVTNLVLVNTNSQTADQIIISAMAYEEQNDHGLELIIDDNPHAILSIGVRRETKEDMDAITEDTHFDLTNDSAILIRRLVRYQNRSYSETCMQPNRQPLREYEMIRINECRCKWFVDDKHVISLTKKDTIESWEVNGNKVKPEDTLLIKRAVSDFESKNRIPQSPTNILG